VDDLSTQPDPGPTLPSVHRLAASPAVAEPVDGSLEDTRPARHQLPVQRGRHRGQDPSDELMICDDGPPPADPFRRFTVVPVPSSDQDAEALDSPFAGPLGAISGQNPRARRPRRTVRRGVRWAVIVGGTVVAGLLPTVIVPLLR
jgi:hypothetical protein